MTVVEYHAKVITFCRRKKWLSLLFELQDLSGNYHSLKAPEIINLYNF